LKALDFHLDFFVIFLAAAVTFALLLEDCAILDLACLDGLLFFGLTFRLLLFGDLLCGLFGGLLRRFGLAVDVDEQLVNSQGKEIASSFFTSPLSCSFALQISKHAILFSAYESNSIVWNLIFEILKELCFFTCCIDLACSAVPKVVDQNYWALAIFLQLVVCFCLVACFAICLVVCFADLFWQWMWMNKLVTSQGKEMASNFPRLSSVMQLCYPDFQTPMSSLRMNPIAEFGI